MFYILYYVALLNMDCDEFNEKWNKYLKEGFYGMNIEDPQVIKYIDDEFTKETVVNPSFQYAQIKMKFGTCRIYASSDQTNIWESRVNEIVNAK